MQYVKQRLYAITQYMFNWVVDLWVCAICLKLYTSFSYDFIVLTCVTFSSSASASSLPLRLLKSSHTLLNRIILKHWVRYANPRWHVLWMQHYIKRKCSRCLLFGKFSYTTPPKILRILDFSKLQRYQYVKINKLNVGLHSGSFISSQAQCKLPLDVVWLSRLYKQNLTWQHSDPYVILKWLDDKSCVKSTMW